MTAVVSAAPAVAQVGVTAEGAGEPASARPGLLSKIHIDQHLDKPLPLDLPFVDESGKQVRLGDYFGKRPVVMALAYYECPMLCTQVLNGLVSALGVMNFEPGREFEVVVVSFNPREGPGLASQKKASYLERYGRPQTAAGWHFLTGQQPAIDATDRCARFPLRLRRGDQAVCARRRHRGADAERAHFEIFLRHRVLGTRSPARAD